MTTTTKKSNLQMKNQKKTIVMDKYYLNKSNQKEIK